ncbi:MAG: hypothetical protein WAN11_09615, partial [Syntrophobacteraceae bacterium]
MEKLPCRQVYGSFQFRSANLLLKQPGQISRSCRRFDIHLRSQGRVCGQILDHQFPKLMTRFRRENAISDSIISVTEGFAAVPWQNQSM